MKRNRAGWVAGIGLVLLGLSCSGTEILGEAAGGSSGTGGTNQAVGGSLSIGGATGNACETPCLVDLFSKQVVMCKLCHAGRAAPNGLQSAGLDLESPDVTARLKDVPAKHTDLAIGMTPADCPVGDKLIDTVNPENSWLLKKIHGQQGNCGTIMPSTGMLTADQRTCVETYVYCVAGRSQPH